MALDLNPGMEQAVAEVQCLEVEIPVARHTQFQTFNTRILENLLVLEKFKLSAKINSGSVEAEVERMGHSEQTIPRINLPKDEIVRRISHS